MDNFSAFISFIVDGKPVEHQTWKHRVLRCWMIIPLIWFMCWLIIPLYVALTLCAIGYWCKTGKDPL